MLRGTGRTQRMLEHALANPCICIEWPTIILAYNYGYAQELSNRFGTLALTQGHYVNRHRKDSITIDNTSVYRFSSITNLDRVTLGQGYFTDILLDNSLEDICYHMGPESTLGPLRSKEMIDFIFENYKEF